ncbi:DUF732 domain-containing protein [Kitasatospora sp. YST-16]|uniref:DUF732 domain-containing protein n=1 Tax=Kitasatospora sp. YST-16 TaxID=2998080 RepID=UPI0022836B0E|nr:DUF732 domain-containing protein [Kitasatospora sp. YST-16]WAL73567.1 DUF732 domain-containing protein [Kitasatospora sp. YST-16]WNW39624.1 DUF732 domain-containing protein [Streptomyces sp. Li-HN-5-13]
MRVRTAAAVLLLAAATACSSSSTTGTTSAPSSAAASPQQSTAAPAGAGAGGLPPKPDQATVTKYIAALDAIDKDIVHGKAETAVSRGRDECSSIGQGKAQDELVKLAIARFTSPDHPQGFGPEKAAKIVQVVHENICPTF